MVEARVLVAGSTGQVGGAAVRALLAGGSEVIGTYRTTPTPGARYLDLADVAAVRRCIREVHPSACVIVGASTNVDACEHEPALAFRVNALAPGVIAEECAALGAKAVLVSTEYVFDGSSGPYGEEDERRPINVYGRSKSAGEDAVLAASSQNLVVRTTVVFGEDPRGKSFVTQVVQRLRRGERMPVPDDQRSSPTYAEDLGRVIAAACRTEVAGVLHAGGPDVLSRYDFALEVARAARLDSTLLLPVPTASLGQKAARPLRAGLRSERLGSLGLPSIRSTRRALETLLGGWQDDP